MTRTAGLALAGLCLATFVGFLVYPTYPNYDSYYSLLWGRELLDGVKPSFEAYRAPTEHPLAIAFGAALSLLGEGGDRVMVFFTLASFVGLAAGMYRLGKVTFGPVVGLLAGALLVTRFDFPFLAARAYIDIPYLMFIVWAAALEAERPRRGRPVFALLALAGLMRPEAWLISGAYFLWMAWRASWRDRIEYAIWTWAATAIWLATDFVVTGDPLFSIHHTSGLAEELGRQRTLSEVPSATVEFLKNLDKVPVFYAGIAGAGLAIWLAPRRVWMPLIVLAIGIGTFFAVGLAGLSVIDRYLLVPSLMVMIFAAVALGGWSLLTPGRVQHAWMAAALAVVAYGTVYTATRVNFHAFTNELTFRGDSHHALQRTLAAPEVRSAARRCGIMVPTHKLLPDVRWVLDLGADDVVARSARRLPRKPSDRDRFLATQALNFESEGSAALLATSRSSVLRQVIVEDSDHVEDNTPPAGYRGPSGASGFYSVYTRC